MQQTIVPQIAATTTSQIALRYFDMDLPAERLR
jgi:hypothetical protein